MELVAEREWDDFGLTDIATRAGVSLSEFRDAFPSKGAVLAGFTRKIDHHRTGRRLARTLADEAPRERAFDVLMRRLDAMAPYKLGLQGVSDWVKRDPLSAAALNGVVLNSMRFMMASAGIDVDGNLAPVKLQGLVFAWGRVLEVWFEDDDPGLARTMAALDRELSRGETWVARLDDLDRLVSPLRIVGRAVMDARRRARDRKPGRAAASAERPRRKPRPDGRHGPCPGRHLRRVPEDRYPGRYDRGGRDLSRGPQAGAEAHHRFRPRNRPQAFVGADHPSLRSSDARRAPSLRRGEFPAAPDRALHVGGADARLPDMDGEVVLIAPTGAVPDGGRLF